MVWLAVTSPGSNARWHCRLEQWFSHFGPKQLAQGLNRNQPLSSLPVGS